MGLVLLVCILSLLAGGLAGALWQLPIPGAERYSALERLFADTKITDWLVVAVTLALVYLGRRQWRTMEAQKEAMHQQGEEMRKSIEVAEINARAATESASVARDTLEATYRAEIAVRNFKASIQRVPKGAAWMMGSFTLANDGRIGAKILRIDISEVNTNYRRSPIESFPIKNNQEITQGFGFEVTQAELSKGFVVTIDVEYADSFKRRRICYGWKTYDVLDSPQWLPSFGRGLNEEIDYDRSGSKPT